MGLSRKELEAYTPQFYLQPGEKVIRTYRCTKWSGPSLWKLMVYSLLTVGIYYLLRNFFKKLSGVQVLVLTNRRLMNWEYTTQDKKTKTKASAMTSQFLLSNLTFYQHEYIRSPLLCFPMKPYNTVRFFFNKFPTELQSYNPASSITPIEISYDDVKDLLSTSKQGFLGNWVSMIWSMFKVIGRIVFNSIKAILNASRAKILLPGHYIEIDTNDDAAIHDIQNLIRDVMHFYPHRDIIKAPVAENTFKFVDDDYDKTRLWSKKDGRIVNLSPFSLQLAPDEKVIDVLPDPISLSWKDFLLAIITLGFWYFWAIRPLIQHRGAIAITDRRVVTIFNHNPNGIQSEDKFLQYTNCWFFTTLGSPMAEKSKPNIWLLGRFLKPRNFLSINVGCGSIQIWANNKIDDARVFSFFSKFFSYDSQSAVLSHAETKLDAKAKPINPHFLLPNEMEIARVKCSGRRGIIFFLQRIFTLGYLPSTKTETLIVTTHRVVQRFKWSNWLNQVTATQEFFLPFWAFRAVSWIEVPGGCFQTPQTTLRLALAGDPEWSISMSLWKKDVTNKQLNEVLSSISTAFFYTENITFGRLGMLELDQDLEANGADYVFERYNIAPPRVHSIYQDKKLASSITLEQSPVLRNKRESSFVTNSPTLQRARSSIIYDASAFRVETGGPVSAAPTAGAQPALHGKEQSLTKYGQSQASQLDVRQLAATVIEVAVDVTRDLSPAPSRASLPPLPPIPTL